MDEFRVVQLYFNSEIHLFTESNLGITSKYVTLRRKYALYLLYDTAPPMTVRIKL